MRIDFDTITEIFRHACRPWLLEHEVYTMLQAMGIGIPQFLFLPPGRTVAPEDLSRFPGESLVLKVVSPLIQHKSEVGGVRFVAKQADAVNEALESMGRTIPDAYPGSIKEGHSPPERPSLQRGLDLLPGRPRCRDF